MSGKTLKLAMLLELNNQLSRGLRTAINDVVRETGRAARSTESVAREANRAARSMETVGTTARSSTRSVESMVAAANRIRSTGVDRMNAALRTTQTTANSVLSTLVKIGSAGVQIGAGVMAGGYVAKSAAERPMTYDRRLALLSNTANNDLDAAGRIAAKERLDKGIRNAVNRDAGGGGGTPEQASETLAAMVSSKVFGDANQALNLLPMFQKASTGTDAPGADLVQIAKAAKESLNIADKDLPAVISKAIRGGQEGSFEINDMAKHLPEQMAKAASLGVTGMAGFEKLIAQNQVSRITAGTSDGAGINMVNLLNKINAPDTQKDFAKHDINLTKSLAAGVAKGKNVVDVFVGLVDRVASKDKDYAALVKKAKTATGSEAKATDDAVVAILRQKGIGSVVQDSQAMSGLLGQLLHRDESNRIQGLIAKENGQEIDTGYQVVANSLDEKANQVGNKKAFAAIDTLKAIEDPLGKLLTALNAEAEAHPKLTQHIYETATALSILAAAAGAAGLVGMLTGKGKAAAAATGGAAEVLQSAATAARPAISYAGEIPLSAQAAAGTAAAAGSGLGLAGLAGLAAAGTGLYAMLKHAMEPDKTSMRLNTDVGIAQRVSDYWNVAPEKQTQPTAPQKVEVVVDVKNGNIVAEVNKANSQQARRN